MMSDFGDGQGWNGNYTFRPTPTTPTHSIGYKIGSSASTFPGSGPEAMIDIMINDESKQ